MDEKHLVVYITTPDMQTGEEIAGALIERKLAACVNLIPVHSIYRWEGEVARDDEVLLIVKTRADLFAEQLVPAVEELHPYQVPEIIALPVVMGTAGYLKWIDEETREK
jgi:periplasmic divalent cation tolerance protein